MSGKLTTNAEQDASPVSDAPEGDGENETAQTISSGNKKKTPEEKYKELAPDYRRQRIYTPLRFQSLPPLYKSTKISLDDFERLRDAVISDQTIVKIPRRKHETSWAEVIVRSCHLLFALIESGGLNSGSPEKEITRLKINVAEARFGLLQPVAPREAKKINETASIAGSNLAGKEKLEATAAAEEPDFQIKGLRQPLYALGRLHLNSFVRLRVTKQKARDGEKLLPALEIKRAEFTEAAGHLPWLDSLPDKSNMTWQHIFRGWLRHHLLILCGVAEKVNWSNVAQLAAWQLLPREHYPFLIAARRRLFQATPLPEAKIKSIYAEEIPVFTKTSRAALSPANENPKEIVAENNRQYIVIDEQNYAETEDIEDEIVPQRNSNADKAEATSNYRYASQILSMLRKSQEKKTFLADSLLNQAASTSLKGAGESDLRNLLRWSARVLKDNEISTAHTYAAKVLRALYSMPQMPFSEWKTEDVAEYLENYATADSVKIVRNSLKQFDDFLVKENLAAENHVAWSSRLLQAPAVYSARDVLSNAEYLKVRELVIDSGAEERLKLRQLCLLTLMRRCGLRSGEAAWLTPLNFFKGFKKWELEITRSKTRAGLRKLPLYLLLDERELSEMRQFVGRQSLDDDLERPLFADEAGNQSTAHFLGREAEKLLRRAGIENDTAHGLRHAFASSLFASFWLNLTEYRIAENQSNALREAFKHYARPEIEGRAAPKLVLIQQLLGHADLRVTFERYVHLLELAGADAVWLYENDAAATPDFINVKVAANILGMDEKLIRVEVGSLTRGAVNLFEIAHLSSSRLS